MSRLRLLDLFCCAGGAAMGYYRAGFDVVGVDIHPQPHYPFEFHRADALAFVAAHGHEYDAIHASPPCQAYSLTRHIHGGSDAPLLIEETRQLLQATGKPYAIENVVGAPLHNPITLCGGMFGLRVYRHRLFEVHPYALSPAHPAHGGQETTNSFRGYSSIAAGSTHITVAGHNFNRLDGMAAMGIDWHMTREEVAQAIPPAYTEYIGAHLIHAMEVTA